MSQDGLPPSARPVRRKIERGFERWGHILSRQPWAAIVLMIGLALGLGSQIRHIRFDTNPEKFLEEGHPARERYDAFRRQYGQDRMILIAVRTPRVFSLDFLAWLRDLHEALEERVPHIDEVDSLYDARSTRGEGERLIVEDLLEDWPRSDADVERIERIARANPLYRDLLVSADGTLTTLSVRLPIHSSEPSPPVDLDC